ncbi:MAG: 3-deoxy-manno-octulosonate cytidylyltransferase [Planctomycetota bacterium]
MTRALAVVPVRVGSSRLPGKALLDETGQSLFLHTFARARDAQKFAAAVVATDDDRIEEAATKAGARVVRTSPDCRTGSERCAEALTRLRDAGEDFEFVVNLQGDWPEVASDDLDALVSALESGAKTATLASVLDEAKADDPNVVKVVRDREQRALYFSRAAIPFARPESQRGDDSDAPRPNRYRHIGVYAFRSEILLALPDLPSSGLDTLEGLEQLKLLEHGIPMRVLLASNDPWGIEARPDYEAFVKRQTEVRR